MTRSALCVEIPLAGFGIADNNRRRPHAPRIAAGKPEIVKERRNIGGLIVRKLELQDAFADAAVAVGIGVP